MSGVACVMRPRGSPETREAMRRLAVARVLEGYDVAEVAAFMGAAPFSVRRRVAAYERDGADGLSAIRHPGPEPRLTADRGARVLSRLGRDPRGSGFVTGRW